MISVFIDGASSGNPGYSGCGAYICVGTEKIKVLFPIGIATNNVAEYMAFLVAMYEVKRILSERKLSVSKLTVYSDSELLVKQWNGIYRVRDKRIKKIQDEIKKVVGHVNVLIEVVHIGREKNQEADKLAKDAAEVSRLIGQVAACKS